MPVADVDILLRLMAQNQTSGAMDQFASSIARAKQQSDSLARAFEGVDSSSVKAELGAIKLSSAYDKLQASASRASKAHSDLSSGIQMTTRQHQEAERAVSSYNTQLASVMSQGVRYQNMQQAMRPAPQEDPVQRSRAEKGGAASLIGDFLKYQVAYSAGYAAFGAVGGSLGRNAAYDQLLGSTAAGTGVSPAAMGGVNQYIQGLAMSGTQPYDKTTLLGGYYGLASANMSVADAQRINTQSAQLSAAFGAKDTTGTNAALLALSSAYGGTGAGVAGRAQKFGDQLTVAVQKGQYSFSDFSSILPRANATTAGKIGISSSDLLSYISMESLAGISSGEVGQDTASLINQLVRPNKVQRAGAKMLGLDISPGAINRAGGFQGFLSNIYTKTAGLDESQRSTVLSGLLDNQAAGRGLSAVFARGFNPDMFNAVGGSAGAGQRAYTTSQAFEGNKLADQTAALTAKFDSLTSKLGPLETATVSAGIQLLDLANKAVPPLVTSLGNLGSTLDDWSRRLNLPKQGDDLSKKVADAGGGIGSFFGGVYNDISGNVSAVTKAAGGAVSGTIGGISAAVGKYGRLGGLIATGYQQEANPAAPPVGPSVAPPAGPPINTSLLPHNFAFGGPAPKGSLTGSLIQGSVNANAFSGYDVSDPGRGGDNSYTPPPITYGSSAATDQANAYAAATAAAANKTAAYYSGQGGTAKSLDPYQTSQDRLNLAVMQGQNPAHLRQDLAGVLFQISRSGADPQAQALAAGTAKATVNTAIQDQLTKAADRQYQAAQLFQQNVQIHGGNVGQQQSALNALIMAMHGQAVGLKGQDLANWNAQTGNVQFTGQQAIDQSAVGKLQQQITLAKMRGDTAGAARLTGQLTKYQSTNASYLFPGDANALAISNLGLTQGVGSDKASALQQQYQLAQAQGNGKLASSLIGQILSADKTAGMNPTMLALTRIQLEGGIPQRAGPQNIRPANMGPGDLEATFGNVAGRSARLGGQDAGQRQMMAAMQQQLEASKESEAHLREQLAEVRNQLREARTTNTLLKKLVAQGAGEDKNAPVAAQSSRGARHVAGH